MVFSSEVLRRIFGLVPKDGRLQAVDFPVPSGPLMFSRNSGSMISFLYQSPEVCGPRGRHHVRVTTQACRCRQIFLWRYL